MLDLFDNVANKIKAYAKVSFAISCIFAILTFVVFLAILEAELWYIGLITLVVLPLVSLISSWLIYGYGEIIENTKNMKNSGNKTQKYELPPI